MNDADPAHASHHESGNHRDSTQVPDASEVYGGEYFAKHCGPVPYERNDFWLGTFGRIADAIIRSFGPTTVFDAGCAIGLLVECLWDRGVFAHGRDISAWAISNARPDIRPCCAVGSIADPVEGIYDLVTCIEVLEHLSEEEALRAIRTLATAAPRILFSSSPVDFTEPTHVNVRPTAYWLSRWAEVGFAPSITHDAGYLAPQAFLLERSETGRSERDLFAFADRIRHRIVLADLGNALQQTRQEGAKWQANNERLSADLLAMGEVATSAREAAGLERARSHDLALGLRSARDALERARLATRAAQQEARSARDEAGAVRDVLAATIEDNERRLGEAARTHDLIRLEADAAERERLAMSAEKEQILKSTSWQATAPVRVAARVFPNLSRRQMRRALRVLRWSTDGRILAQLRARREVLVRADIIAASEHFDPDWYRSAYEGIDASGLAPHIHYAATGGVTGHDPGPSFSVARYVERHPDATTDPGGPFWFALRHGQTTDGAAGSVPERVIEINPMPVSVATEPPPVEEQRPPSVHDLLRRRFIDNGPLPVFTVPRGERIFVNLVTDSVGRGSLYGGVGTALVLGRLAATRLGAGLRLITRTEPADLSAVHDLLDAHGIDAADEIETVHAPRLGDLEGDREVERVPASERDVFLTTSWWTTWSAAQSVRRSRVVYLLQEDERMFYPSGDDRIRCAAMMSDPGLLYLVNSRLLHRHLDNRGLAPGATSFEPSFPASMYWRERRPSGGKRQFLFYARPHNARNLYWRGLEAVTAAIEENVLDPDEWDFVFVGHGADALELPGGLQPIIPGPMTWTQYAALARGTDLGLSLMNTPHPSYPPIDLAASGSVVVTNRFGPKQDLELYSRNIVCSDVDVPSLVKALARARDLSADEILRSRNYEDSKLSTDWNVSLSGALDRFHAWAQG